MPPDFASELIDIKKRLVKIESFPAGGMTLLTSQNGSGVSGLPFTTTPSQVGGTETLLVYFQRPVPLYITGSISFASVGGTASWAYVQLGIYVPPVGGVFFCPPVGVHTNTTTAGVSDVTRTYVMDATVWATFAGITWPASVAAGWFYSMDAGATTTFTMYGSSLEIFQMSG